MNIIHKVGLAAAAALGRYLVVHVADMWPRLPSLDFLPRYRRAT